MAFRRFCFWSNSINDPLPPPLFSLTSRLSFEFLLIKHDNNSDSFTHPTKDSSWNVLTLFSIYSRNGWSSSEILLRWSLSSAYRLERHSESSIFLESEVFIAVNNKDASSTAELPNWDFYYFICNFFMFH